MHAVRHVDLALPAVPRAPLADIWSRYMVLHTDKGTVTPGRPFLEATKRSSPRAMRRTTNGLGPSSQSMIAVARFDASRPEPRAPLGSRRF
jgi:hypothetical protein